MSSLSIRLAGALVITALLACGAGAPYYADDGGDGSGGGGGSGGGAGGGGGGNGVCGDGCANGFHCEFDNCVPDVPAPGSDGAGRSPLISRRYVFSLQVEARRLVRIDSANLTVAVFPAGLGPMDLGVIGSRELSLLLDGFDLVEVLDHRTEPPQAAAWDTARALSHLALSPTGAHAVAYFDWDDPRAQERQPEPGNINQVTVLALQDHPGRPERAFADADPRAINVAVGFLPRDVRFSSDGERAVVVSRDTLTPLTLGDPLSGGTVAQVARAIPFDGDAGEIATDAALSVAVLRYDGGRQVDVIDLAAGVTVGCFEALAAVDDVAFTPDGQLLVLAGDGGGADGAALSIVDVGAAVSPCLPIGIDVALSAANRLAVGGDATSPRVAAYQPTLDVERLWRVDVLGRIASSVRLEKAVSGVAFADGAFAVLSHLKAPGTPAWDPVVEEPDASVDKSYGVTWVDLGSGAHRLEVADDPFGAFTFVPPVGAEPGATFQASLTPAEPHVLRVVHQPGFADRRIDLAAAPLDLGFFPETQRVFVTQSHPWGRITFLDPAGGDVRHVTGFALGEP